MVVISCFNSLYHSMHATHFNEEYILSYQGNFVHYQLVFLYRINIDSHQRLGYVYEAKYDDLKFCLCYSSCMSYHCFITYHGVSIKITKDILVVNRLKRSRQEEVLGLFRSYRRFCHSDIKWSS